MTGGIRESLVQLRILCIYVCVYIYKNMSQVPGPAPPRVGYDIGGCPPLGGGGAPHFSHMSREICPMSAQILNDRGGASAAGAADQQGGPMPTTGGRESSAASAAAPNLHPQGGRELISRRRSSTKSPPTGGERAHQQQALQRQICNHRGRESSAAGAPAPNLQPQGGRERSSRAAGAPILSPTRGGEAQDLGHICPRVQG